MQQAMQQNLRDYIADVAYQACLIIVSPPSPDILSLPHLACKYMLCWAVFHCQLQLQLQYSLYWRLGCE